MPDFFEIVGTLILLSLLAVLIMGGIILFRRITNHPQDQSSSLVPDPPKAPLSNTNSQELTDGCDNNLLTGKKNRINQAKSSAMAIKRGSVTLIENKKAVASAVRLGSMAVLILLLLIPVNLIKKLVTEREYHQINFVNNLANEWGNSQVLIGPILAVPYTVTYYITEKVPLLTGLAPPAVSSGTPSTDQDIKTNESELTFRTVRREVEATRWAALTPEILTTDGDLKTQTRSRGIYEVLVWSSALKLSGRFALPTKEEFVKRLSIEETLTSINWAQAKVVVGLSDTTALTTVGKLNLGGGEYKFDPGIGSLKGLPQGFSAAVDLSQSFGTTEFSFDLGFNGSASLRIAAIADDTTISLRSNWPHPSFVGNGLPASRQISSDGFTADWRIPAMVHTYQSLRNIPQDGPPPKCDGNYEQCNSSEDSIYGEFTAGVYLINPVEGYLKTERAVKYAIMFITLTFLIFVLSESQATKIHLVQYAVIGLALALFYLVLLALSEHLSFGVSYLAASALDVALVTGYGLAVTGRKVRVAVVGILTAFLYGTLYVILNLEDYALLAGSALLTAALVALMVSTRNLSSTASSVSQLDQASSESA
ncbi:MAG: cell envelope integrity protein CreD [Deltaproteobacteria bacterium]|jgi:inner membrane protein|nr:cell envelope integrity protein CreD [Deltaproteobacteria bacterium]